MKKKNHPHKHKIAKSEAFNLNFFFSLENEILADGTNKHLLHASFLGDIQFYSVILLHHLSVAFEEDCFKLKWRATCPSMLLCLIKSRPTKWVVEKDIDYWGKSFKKLTPKEAWLWLGGIRSLLLERNHIFLPQNLYDGILWTTFFDIYKKSHYRNASPVIMVR